MKDLAKATSDVRKVFVEEVTWTALVGWVQTQQEERQLGMESGRKLKRSPHRGDAPAFLALEGRAVRKQDTGQDNWDFAAVTKSPQI